MKIETVQFKPTDDSIDTKVARAEAAILALYREGRPLILPFSGGKDSGVVTSIGLNAARKFAQAGGKPVVLATTSNTGIENPEIEMHYILELEKMRAYGQQHGFEVRTKIVRPSLASTWQLKILSGRGIPSFMGASSDCSVDLKVKPQRAYRNRLFRDLKANGMPLPVTALGTRFDESTIRAHRMHARGDHAETPVLNKHNELVLSPIAHFTEDDVWEYIGMVTSGLFESYTDFEETNRIYAHSAGTSCVMVAQAIYEVDSPTKKNTGCGARHGCFLCQKTEDKSLEAMIAFDERYAYMRGLFKLNKFIRATRYDWTRRHYVGRTIKGGYVEIKPDTYHPKMLRDLTRYMLQIDYDEGRRAERAGERRRFHLLPPEMVVAVDAMQNMNGVAAPFQIWADIRDIYKRKIRYDVPELDDVPENTPPQTKYMHVGDDWDSNVGGSAWNGLRDAYVEGLVDDAPCGPDVAPLKDGRIAWDVDTGPEFDINMESVYMIEDFEMERLLEDFDRGYGPSGIAGGYKWYIRYGALRLAANQVGKHDEILRRTALKDRLGLTLHYDVDDLYARAVQFEDMTEEGKRAWKRTTEEKAARKASKKMASAAVHKAKAKKIPDVGAWLDQDADAIPGIKPSSEPPPVLPTTGTEETETPVPAATLASHMPQLSFAF